MAIARMRLIILKTRLAPTIGPELIALHRSLGIAAHALTFTARAVDFTARAVDLLDEVPNLLRP